MTKLYEEQFEYQTADDIKGNIASGHTLYFRSESERLAVCDVERWWKCRNSDWPDVYRRLCSVTLYDFDPGPITSEGRQVHRNAYMVYQWKISTGCGPGVCRGADLVENPIGDPYNDYKQVPRFIHA